MHLLFVTFFFQNGIKGNKPISIGHSYSVICALPEGIATGNVPWAVPLLAERVPSSEKATNIGNKQLEKSFKLLLSLEISYQF
ncbi:MAG: transposase [Okeania sp. SIO3B5]|uniref:hypothetical protein n=1 Tax=Okeania sp. SIO3B5 TaxID=2607811 RepID=UPI001401B3A8|nr:hypothetical protein [Okeania sp. SIO3B5]NEO55835.1 transposase [Okeania sp. SIO3B5]